MFKVVDEVLRDDVDEMLGDDVDDVLKGAELEQESFDLVLGSVDDDDVQNSAFLDEDEKVVDEVLRDDVDEVLRDDVDEVLQDVGSSCKDQLRVLNDIAIFWRRKSAGTTRADWVDYIVD